MGGVKHLALGLGRGRGGRIALSTCLQLLLRDVQDVEAGDVDCEVPAGDEAEGGDGEEGA